MKINKLLTYLLFLVLSDVYADLPLTIEDLTTDKGSFKLELALTYANVEQTNVSAVRPILVATGSTSVVEIPTVISERNTNTGTLITTLGLRYGITGDLDMYLWANHLSVSNRIQDIDVWSQIILNN